MTTFLIYSNDACGKSVQMKNICEMSESPIYISLELKNRKLLNLDPKTGLMTDETPFDVVEVIKLTPHPSYQTDYIRTYAALGIAIQNVINGKGVDGKLKCYDTVVIDGISDFDKMCERVVVTELQKTQKTRMEIGENDLASWETRNNLSCMPIEQLGNWAVVTGANVFLTTLFKGEYLKKIKTGYKVHTQDRIKEKVCDVRVMLTNDGRGYLAKFEKVPAWANEGVVEMVIGKSGLATEFVKRGLI